MLDLPEMTPLKSSNLGAVGQRDGYLYVRFKGRKGEPGPVWRYQGAGAHHAAFLTTDSPGRLFLAKVKLAYRGERVE